MQLDVTEVERVARSVKAETWFPGMTPASYGEKLVSELLKQSGKAFVARCYITDDVLSCRLMCPDANWSHYFNLEWNDGASANDTATANVETRAFDHAPEMGPVQEEGPIIADRAIVKGRKRRGR